MARWFRSEEMEYISLIVNQDAAHDCLADLGRLGVIQFPTTPTTAQPGLDPLPASLRDVRQEMRRA